MTSINHLGRGQQVNTLASSQRKATSGAAETNKSNTDNTSSAAKKDAISLSEQGKSIGNLHKTVSNGPGMNSAKVAAIQQAISDGSYRVNPSQVAGKMVSLEGQRAGL